MACALDAIGDHWSLLIIRGMMFVETHEYKDFLAMPESISSNILTDRLKKLEKCAMIKSAPHPKSKRRKLYYLTPKGKNLAPVLIEIARWAAENLGDDVFIPEDKRPYFDMPLKDVTAMTLEKLSAWEKENIPS